jgi:hypothetical protein
MFERLELENFTVFEKARFEWAAGINVFVGANGTGKTHLLKLLYCLQTSGHDDNELIKKLSHVFLPSGESIHSLVRNGMLLNYAHIATKYGEHYLDKNIGGYSLDIQASSIAHSTWQPEQSSVYIPPKEVLSTAPGFMSLYQKYRLALDEVYFDVTQSAYLPHLRHNDAQQQAILALLEPIIGGQVSIQGDVFFVGSRTMHLVAEGHRKLALIWQLIRNGSIATGATLFWDEPEANLNPIMMQEVVKVLLMLAQSGVQIFVATHSDAFMRELDYQKSEVPTRFFALEKTDDGVISHLAERYLDVQPNPIEDEYARLYDLEVQRSLGLL